MMRRLLASLSLAVLILAPALASGQAASPFPINRTATLQNAVTTTGNGNTIDTARMAIVTIQVSGSLSSTTVVPEGSNDNSNWNTLTCYTLDSGTSAASFTATGMWRCNVAGIALVRARISANSGTVTVVANASSASNLIRDQFSLSGAITGQLRGTQTTAPTCAVLNGGGATIASTCVVDGGGTDSFIRAHIVSGLTAAQLSPNVQVTFNAAYSATPACTAAYDDAGGYGYYLYAVAPSTTTATLKLGPGVNSIGRWVPQSQFSVICAGTQ